jgi:hypothetical protein
VDSVISAANPYAAPTAHVDDVGLNPEAEAIRRAHITHEASIRAVGLLYYLGGIAVTVGGLVMLAGLRGLEGVWMVVLLLLLGGVQVFAGWGVRALRAWGRGVGSVLSAIGLLGFPVGTLINTYILYLFFSKKGRTIFSPPYHDIIAATPEVKYRTSIVVWVFLALLVVLILAVAVTPMFAR